MRKLTLLAVGACLSFVLITVKPGYSEKNAPKNKKSTAASDQQDATKTPANKRATKRRLPRYFGKLGLSDVQRDKVYGIQEKFRPQIRELEEQIQDLKKLRSIEMTGVLTNQQTQELAQLREAAKQKTEQRKAKKAKAKKRSKKSKNKAKDRSNT